MPRRIKREQIVTYHRARFGEGLTQRNAADIAGVSTNWATKQDKLVRSGEVRNYAEGWTPPAKVDKDQVTKRKKQALAEAADEIPPIPPDLWTPEALHQAEDFHYFCEVQFGIIPTPWRRAAFTRLWKLWETDEKEYVVLNAPPGVGKSQITSHDLPVWLTVRDRRMRGLIGSSTDRLATPYTRKIRDSFMRRIPLTAHDNDKRLGLAIDAKSTLIRDFGRFRGEDAFQLWQAHQFMVEQYDGAQTGEKEPTWQAYGRGAEVLGNRQGIIAWDDLVTRRSMRETMSDEFLNWFEDEAETRLEPGGLFVLNGQRLGDDLYRNRLDCEVLDLDDEGNEVVYKKYHHIVFQAHAGDNCHETHPDHTRHARFQEFDDDGVLRSGTGCLLDPKRLTWRELRQIAYSNPQKYDVVYQQSDAAVGDTLVDKQWIYGGENNDGEVFPGCLDRERDALMFPEGLEPRTVSVGSVDPSGSNRWSVQWWLNEPTTDIDHLMDLYLGQLTAGELLSFNPQTQKFYGMMDEWQRRSVELGRPIEAWIVETNAAQRYLLQHAFVHQWMTLNNVRIISHETHARNKHDPEHGFWQMRNQYRWGKCRLPGAGAGHYKSLDLTSQATRWTAESRGGKGGDDALMAQWIYRVNLKQVLAARPNQDLPPARSGLAPSWMRG